MNKSDLIVAISQKTEQPKTQITALLGALASTIAEALKKDEKISWTGFGSFSVTKRAARKGRNPKTGKAMKIKAARTPRFKAGKTLRDAI